MELRILYAVISWIASWIASFLNKISAEKWYNSYQFTWYTFLSSAFFSLIFFLSTKENLANLLPTILMWIIMWIAYTVTNVSRIEALKNISTTLYFPAYKIWSTILAFIVWISFFTDTIKTNEILWVIIGLLVPIVLINKKEHLNHTNMSRWITMIIISIISAVVTVSLSKIIIFLEMNVVFYIFVWTFTWWIISLIQYNLKYKKVLHYTKKIKRICLINWLLIASGTLFFIKALSWNLWVAMTINSFWLVIPIILSVIIYKDHFDLRKIIALILTVISMLFFKLF